jgi:hypothetical protein
LGNQELASKKKLICEAWYKEKKEILQALKKPILKIEKINAVDFQQILKRLHML